MRIVSPPPPIPFRTWRKLCSFEQQPQHQNPLITTVKSACLHTGWCSCQLLPLGSANQTRLVGLIKSEKIITCKSVEDEMWGGIIWSHTTSFTHEIILCRVVKFCSLKIQGLGSGFEHRAALASALWGVGSFSTFSSLRGCSVQWLCENPKGCEGTEGSTSQSLYTKTWTQEFVSTHRSTIPRDFIRKGPSAMVCENLGAQWNFLVLRGFSGDLRPRD